MPRPCPCPTAGGGAGGRGSGRQHRRQHCAPSAPTAPQFLGFAHIRLLARTARSHPRAAVSSDTNSRPAPSGLRRPCAVGNGAHVGWGLARCEGSAEVGAAAPCVPCLTCSCSRYSLVCMRLLHGAVPRHTRRAAARAGRSVGRCGHGHVPPEACLPCEAHRRTSGSSNARNGHACSARSAVDRQTVSVCHAVTTPRARALERSTAAPTRAPPRPCGVAAAWTGYAHERSQGRVPGFCLRPSSAPKWRAWPPRPTGRGARRLLLRCWQRGGQRQRPPPVAAAAAAAARLPRGCRRQPRLGDTLRWRPAGTTCGQLPRGQPAEGWLGSGGRKRLRRPQRPLRRGEALWPCWQCCCRCRCCRFPGKRAPALLAQDVLAGAASPVAWRLQRRWRHGRRRMPLPAQAGRPPCAAAHAVE